MNVENSTLPKSYVESTRYVRPVKLINFGEKDMVHCFSQYFNAEEILSLAQLVGDRKGVIRVTLKSRTAVKKFDELLNKKKLCVMSVPCGSVDDQGQFQTIYLENVPQCVTDEQLEDHMGRFGVVAGSTREYLDFKGCKIENERRTVLFTALFTHSSVPPRIKICDNVVHCRTNQQAANASKDQSSSSRPPQKFSPVERQNFMHQHPAMQNANSLNSLK